jgi:hypothetical protein
MGTVLLVATIGGLLVGAGGAPDREAAAKQARLAELNARLDALYQKVLAPAEGGFSAENIDERVAAYREAATLKREIVSLTLPAADAGRFNDFIQKQTDALVGLVEVWRDPDLDAIGKLRRFRELSQDLQTLQKDYADVIAKAPSFDRNAIQQRAQTDRLERLRQALKVSDEEWQVLAPILREVLKLMEELDGLRGRRSAAREGDRGLLARLQPERRTQAERELADLLKQDNVPAATVKAKLDAVRQERADRAKKAEAVEVKLKAARERLRALLSIRQEAVLVDEDILD